MNLPKHKISDRSLPFFGQNLTGLEPILFEDSI